MEKLILIDGNSLLNRAFYAMNVFTTKDGLPTNGIFGFIKLLFKILADEKPKYLAVAFDVHAPTFRHKMYADYKGTRRPMPEELVRQVPVLKELLSAMEIRMVELEGYEADDLLGTLSRAYPGVHSYIYTGDRDAYQLVGERVSVCFTKRGVSDLDRLDAENFTEKVGLTPAQIVEEKALMGDSSDNIPGVRGIGPKTALSLLRTYGDLEGVYAALGELSPKLKGLLEEGRESAFFSRKLATIDTAAPLDIPLESCEVRLPFSEKAREMFVRLEFRSLSDSAFFPAARVREAAIEERMSSDLGDIPQTFDRFAFSFEEEGCHVWIAGRELLFPCKKSLLDRGFFPGELKPLYTQLFTGGKRAIVTDAKSVLHRLSEFGVEADCPMEDVTLLRYLADSNLRPLSAKELAKDYGLPEGNCAHALALAYEDAAKRTAGAAEETLYRDVELPLVRVLYDMEQTGVCVDMARFPEFSEKFRAELDELSAQIHSLAGVKSVNLNSPQQLSELLFDKLGYSAKGVKKTARGYSTNADVLETLAEEHEIARLILRYREIGKLRSTYIDGIRPLIVNGKIHTTYNQTATTTGRLSSANPNLQNIPVRRELGRELRKLFVAQEGNVLVDADYSQIELRLLAHFSGCKPLQEAYREGRDIHAATAAQVFNVPLAGVTPLMRRRAKAVNFGIIYGISAFGLAKDVGCTVAQAQEYIERYFAQYPAVKEYMNSNVENAKRDGYVTTVLGRKRYIPELRSPNFNMRSFGERAAMNMPLQGSAADIIKLAMLRVDRRLRREGMRARLVLQVHDELVLDAPEEEAERAAALLKEEMEAAIALEVPLVAEVSCGRSWYDAK